MNNTKDKVKDGAKEFLENEKSMFYESFDKINLIKYINNTQDEMSKNSIESYIGEYNLIYLEDEVYLNLTRELKIYTDLRADAFNKLILNDNISQEERDFILNHIKSYLNPLIEELEIKLDTRRSNLNLDRKDYIKESDEKNTPRKNAMLGLGLGTSTFAALFTYPKTRKIIIDNGKKIVDVAIQKGTKLL